MTETIYKSSITLPPFEDNLALMLSANAQKLQISPVFQEEKGGVLIRLSWQQFYHDICKIQYFLASIGFKAGDHMAVLSPNRREMLLIELAVMAMGGISIPIFSGYSKDIACSLIEFCKATFIAVADESQFQKLYNPGSYRQIINFDPLESRRVNCILFQDILSGRSIQTIQGLDIHPDKICLMMYTSGTMGKPKCVQLTHKNILSQQSAMRVLWKLSAADRFLSYLPWHHSFGGIFEKYAALCNGAVLSLETSLGKNIHHLLENWRLVKPTVFFSVPRIYQAITTMIRQQPEIEEEIFHKDLRFIFTAAAPLPKNISDMFENRNIPVYEGWGLTETSPCCTVTDPEVRREAGVVGKPIPGVSIKFSPDGEIMIKGPNVMKGYFHNPEETQKVLKENGWFCTGDVGEYTLTGLKLISRKDRIFKLTNAEKVVPSDIENLLSKDCAYLSHSLVSGSGKDYPVVLLFPNSRMFDQQPDESQFVSGCRRPENLKEFFTCLKTCLNKWNHTIDEKYARIRKAMLIDYELTIENDELTPSMKLAPNVVAKVFKAQLELLYESENKFSEEVFVINLDD